MKICIVDDNLSFRKTLRLFIEGHLKYEINGEYEDGESFLHHSDCNTDIILMDINMPQINGVEVTKHITFINHNLNIIAVSQYEASVDLHTLIASGFKGFVSKTNLYRDLKNAIHKVYSGGMFFPDEMINKSKTSV